MIDLATEMVDALDGLDERAERWLRQRGVPARVIHEHPGPVGVATIETDMMSTYQPAESDARAFIQPVWLGEKFSEICDLIAWQPDRPDRWWTRRRSGEQLGAQHLDWAEINQTALIIRRSPLSWLRSGGRGVFVADWPAALPRLRQVPVLIAEELEHGVVLERRFAEPVMPVPEIRFPVLEPTCDA